jgi:rod shape-determining protein MreC
MSLVLLFNNNPYQQHVYMTSAGEVSSSIYGVTNNITSYFNLRENNEDLNRRNADLQLEVISLKEQIQQLQDRLGDDTLRLAPVLAHYDFVVARVINNSVIRPHNYITINKGSDDGIAAEMGVIDQNGVVGVVNVVGRHSARVISLLNPHFRLSCKIKGNESFGSLVWDGVDPEYALLEELPRHTVFHPGDTIITSGYSAVFPEGIPVGIVATGAANHNENFFTLKIKLLSDFTKLNNVQIVVNNRVDEIRAVEAGSTTEDTEN